MTETTHAAEGAASKSDAARENMEKFTRIGEMARSFDVTLRALRFYEDRGLIDPRREGTTRLYSRRDRARLRLVLLGRRVGFSLREVKQIMDLYDPKGPNTRQLRMVLEKSQRQLGRLEARRAALDEAIGELTDMMENVRDRLDAAQPLRRTG
ncbi:MAG: MerR family transcriptional regulator [Hyphomicrobiales bacterium]|nr:MerR family transcriptional regulator [Hyphomicrobiales bacterium]